MSYSTYPYPDDYLTAGVLSRRVFAWLIDCILIVILGWLLWWLLVLFGVLTLGLGFHAMVLLPWVPFLYNFLSLISQGTATPGQRVMGLAVRRNDDLGPPTPLQAAISVILYYVTLTIPLLMLVALFTIRHRTLHDLFSGLVVVRAEAMQALTGSSGI
ncbi:MAG TPA: RDD family protein [Rhodopila sp.]|uniref:RDD family protein n=1 Tax=Rhodopila sp. TaxID=2480087 RepID=UPI002C79EA30|nr:RDD family protein [Rhodopila sp.]HVY15758.1 RDD family protein [Rhodopila sp.]